MFKTGLEAVRARRAREARHVHATTRESEIRTATWQRRRPEPSSRSEASPRTARHGEARFRKNTFPRTQGRAHRRDDAARQGAEGAEAAPEVAAARREAAPGGGARRETARAATRHAARPL